MSAAEIVVLGDINIDVVLSVSDYPQPGSDALAARIATRAGGSAANTAIVLAKLGVAVKMIGRVGDDTWGDLTLRALAESGVDVSKVQRDTNLATGLFVIPVTPDGERTMLGYRGANARTDPSPIEPGLFTDVRCLHVSGYALLESPQREAAWRAIDLADRSGAAISLDAGLYPVTVLRDEVRAALPRLSIGVLGMDEARLLVDAETPEEAAAQLVVQGVQLVGLKLGARGCVLADGSRVCRLPAFAALTIDTTGAGDAFSAGLIWGRLRGLSLPAMGVLANALGGLATSVPGSGPALPGRAEAIALLRAEHERIQDERREWIDEVLTVMNDER